MSLSGWPWLRFGPSLDWHMKENILSSAAGSHTPDWAAKVEWLEAQGCQRTLEATQRAAALPDAEALAHTEAALTARPQDAAPRYVRAYVHYFGDAPARARDELNLVLAQSGEAERGYAPIWLYLADRRAGGDGETAVSRHLEERPRSAWPHPVLDHLRGRLDVDALLRAARAAGTDPGPQVEAWFYAGQKALLDGDLARARKCFQEAQALGVVEYNEHGMALRALKSLVRR